MQQTLWQYRRAIAVTGVLVVVAVAAFSLGNRHSPASSAGSSQQQTKTVAVAPSGISYPSGWQEAGNITVAQQQVGVISVAEHSNPSAEVIVRTAQYALPKNFDINSIPAETVSKLRSSLDGFKLVSDTVTKAGNLPAVSITYTIAGDPVYEYTELIVPTANTAYYLTFSSQQSDFSGISADAGKITTALANYIAAKQ